MSEQPSIDIDGTVYLISWPGELRRISRILADKDDDATKMDRRIFMLHRQALERAKQSGLSLWFLEKGTQERCGEPEQRTPASSRVIHLATELKPVSGRGRHPYVTGFSGEDSPMWHNAIRAMEDREAA